MNGVLIESLCDLEEFGSMWMAMTLNLWMIVERYPNRMEWLAIQFPAVKPSLYWLKNQLGGQAPFVFKKEKK
jgi:hypothetical protein